MIINFLVFLIFTSNLNANVIIYNCDDHLELSDDSMRVLVRGSYVRYNLYEEYNFYVNKLFGHKQVDKAKIVRVYPLSAFISENDRDNDVFGTVENKLLDLNIERWMLGMKFKSKRRRHDIVFSEVDMECLSKADIKDLYILTERSLSEEFCEDQFSRCGKRFFSWFPDALVNLDFTK